MQGPWAPKKIANPDYFLDESPLANLGSIGGVAIEIWTMDEGYLFSNVLIANDAAEAEQKRTSLWAPKKEAEVGFWAPRFTLLASGGMWVLLEEFSVSSSRKLLLSLSLHSR